MAYTLIDDEQPQGYTLLPQSPSHEEVQAKVSIAQSLAHQAGLTSRYAIEGVLGLPEMMGTAAGKLLHYASFGVLPNPQPGAVSRALTNFGFAEPQGKVERIVGDASRALAGTGGVAAAASKLTNAAGPVVQNVIDNLAANTGAQAVGAVGSGVGAGGAREAGLGPGAQFVASLLGGMVVPTVGNAAWETTKAAGRWGQAIAQPFWQGGREAAAGNIINEMASDPAAVNAQLGVLPPMPKAARDLRAANGYPLPEAQPIPQYVPGSQVTTATAVRDPGLLSLEAGLRGGQDNPFGALDRNNNTARTNYFRGISGTQAELDALKADRQANANADYNFAYSEPTTASARTERQLAPLWSSPTFKQAWQIAERIAADKLWRPEQISPDNPEFMHLVKITLDKLGGSGAANPADRAVQGGVADLQHSFLDALDNIAPAYGIARGNYAAASPAIDQRTTLLDILNKATNTGETLDKNQPLSLAGWDKHVTDQAPVLAETLTPDQMGVLGNIGQDMNRSALPFSYGIKTPGSNTFKNIATDQTLSAAGGPTLSASPLSKVLSMPVQKLFEWSGSNDQVKQLVVEAMKDPDIAAQYLAAASRGLNPTLGQLFAAREQGIVQGGALGTGITTGLGSP